MWNTAAGPADCGRLARQTCRRGLFTLILALLAGLSMMALSGDAAAQKVAGGENTPPPPPPAGQHPEETRPQLADCGPDWVEVSSYDVGAHQNLFSGVAAVSADDVWAVGTYQNTSLNILGLVEHWNGTAWTYVSSPNQGPNENDLYSVAAVSSNDVWAAGSYYYNAFNTHTLTEHWDGTAWSIVPSPNAGTSDNVLARVSATAANDVWAVGRYVGTPYFQTLIEHWDGSSWSIVPSPNRGSASNDLYGVAALAANDAWAVGYSTGATLRTLTEHWNGSSWSIVPSPNPGGDSVLNAVSAAAPNDVWAVGTYSSSAQTLIEHWDCSALPVLGAAPLVAG